MQPFQKIIRIVLNEDYPGFCWGEIALFHSPPEPQNVRSPDFLFWTNIKSELHENAAHTRMDTDVLKHTSRTVRVHFETGYLSIICRIANDARLEIHERALYLHVCTF